VPEYAPGDRLRARFSLLCADGLAGRLYEPFKTIRPIGTKDGQWNCCHHHLSVLTNATTQHDYRMPLTRSPQDVFRFRTDSGPTAFAARLCDALGLRILDLHAFRQFIRHPDERI
jgi:hypothetical protein